jgi:outer membrane lipoprotein-sorting protein
MHTQQFAFVFWFLFGGMALLGCGGPANPVSTTAPISEILYVIDDGTVTTYSIDNNSLAATAVEQPVSPLPAGAALVQFDPSPHDNFIYAVWSDREARQHLSVFFTDSSGVPQPPAIQILNAAFLSQFNMHPSGRFAYMLEVTTSNGLYQAHIRLFHGQAGKGTLKEDPRVQGSYGPAYFWPAFLYGFSADASKLYDTSITSTGSVFRERPIDLRTGTLDSDKQLLSVSDEAAVAIGKVIVKQYQSDSNVNQSYVDILPDAPNPQPTIIHCTIAMLTFCATATNIQLDRSSHYLFLTDPATQAVHVAAIDLPGRKIRDTGSSMPMTAQTPGFAFSPDGTIIYAILATDNSVHFYHFSSAFGSLKEGGNPLPLPSGAGICPAQRH